MPLQATSGAASYDGFGGGVPIIPQYIEELFSTLIYTGNSSTQVITNGIDLSTKGGLVWTKNRNSGPNSHLLFDTIRGTGKYLSSDTTNGQITNATTLTSFNSNGFTLGVNASYNNTVTGYCSWTFREQPKFFDIVTYTGDGTDYRTIDHLLGSKPGSIIIKRTDSTSNWYVWHRLNPIGQVGSYRLDTTAPCNNTDYVFDSFQITDTYFKVNSAAAGPPGQPNLGNINGATYVAYLFAHNAGGFGLSGSENAISCGGYTCVAYPGDVEVTLGYEPQWVMVKNASQASNWVIYDMARGMPGPVPPNPVTLAPDSAAQENGVTGDAPGISPIATGFIARAGLTAVSGSAGDLIIYIAIRRGPMKVPTSGSSVFSPQTTANGTLTEFAFDYPDTILNYNLTATAGWQMVDRLRGMLNGFASNTSGATTVNRYLTTNSTAAQSTSSCRIGGLGIARAIATQGSWAPLDPGVIGNGNFATAYFFKRAPSFFDTVCDTGTGAAHTISHNLGVAPQLMIRKRTNSTSNWCVYPNDVTQVLFLDATNPFGTNGATYWNSTAPTASVFSIGTNTDVNTNGGTYVNYLFATCPGVSKVFSYTGNGSSQTINCGFTAGSRWVMIKRTDVAGDWYVWDSANGIVAGNDPHLSLNTASAQVTTDDSIDTDNTGFVVNQVSATNVNVTSGTYIGIAIA
jgi:hypothetical protein